MKGTHLQQNVVTVIGAALEIGNHQDRLDQVFQKNGIGLEENKIQVAVADDRALQQVGVDLLILHLVAQLHQRVDQAKLVSTVHQLL